MDYTNNGVAQQQLQQMQSPGLAAGRPIPELGRLKAAAERVSRAEQQIDNFVTRFHGSHPECENQTSGGCSDNYRNDLDALFSAIERLEYSVSTLDHIG
jgi:hypothetical protein